jgi:UDP-glucose 4-epimerase
MATILVTGGAGYIGSHTCVELLNGGFDVVVFDNLCNSHPEALARVRRITGKRLHLIRGDCRDRTVLAAALRDSGASAVIHFAGLKAVGESVKQPLAYYDNNVVGTLRLLEAMRECEVPKLVFSSSATVYGDPKWLPLTENHPLSATNPYGQSKLMVEEILRDLHRSDPSWHLAILRYFNPVGAHPSGLIGEDPLGTPDNLMPFVAQVAVGRREILNVWGNDYPTPDGTGVRDYIHVVDLALGHIKALQALDMMDGSTGQRPTGCLTVNLGTGTGYSVLDMVHAFEKASGRRVPYRIASRRPGDIASCYADPKLARELLGWQAERGLEEMCADAWRWQNTNPAGYRGGDSREDAATG